jgi:pyridoxamine 5'-phosphate oxidase family protein
MLSKTEIEYLKGQRLGRLATQKPDGTLQNSPVGFGYNALSGTIDIGGHSMSSSAKYRNVAANGRVAFVVDDIVSTDPWRVRMVEIRGRAEVVPAIGDPSPGRDSALIRVHPEKVISFGLDSAPPME